jgi:hypothetical protein
MADPATSIHFNFQEPGMRAPTPAIETATAIFLESRA